MNKEALDTAIYQGAAPPLPTYLISLDYGHSPQVSVDRALLLVRKATEKQSAGSTPTTFTVSELADYACAGDRKAARKLASRLRGLGLFRTLPDKHGGSKSLYVPSEEVLRAAETYVVGTYTEEEQGQRRRATREATLREAFSSMTLARLRKQASEDGLRGSGHIKGGKAALVDALIEHLLGGAR